MRALTIHYMWIQNSNSGNQMPVSSITAKAPSRLTLKSLAGAASPAFVDNNNNNDNDNNRFLRLGRRRT
jgi:hypothetical protein